MQVVSRTKTLDSVADPSTDPRLLPPGMRPTGNERRMRHFKLALHYAINNCITDTQRTQLYLFYWRGMRKKDIAAHLGVGAPAVSKALQNAHIVLRRYITQYMSIYDRLEREFLQERDG